MKSFALLDYGLVAVFILCLGYIAYALFMAKEGFEYYPPNAKNDYAKYKSKCAYPCGYHRYQSNTCDPTQDELPITMPNPNAALPPMKLTPEDEMMIGIMSGSQPCGDYGKINLCQ